MKKSENLFDPNNTSIVTNLETGDKEELKPIADGDSQGIEIKPLELSGQIAEQVAIARRYPRSITKCFTDLEALATANKEVAGQCFYSLPRKSNGKTIYIEGPGVRLAEMGISVWGNCLCFAYPIGYYEERVIAEALFWDMEKNVAFKQQVTRSILDSKGRRYPQHLIESTMLSAVSIALRNVAFRGIPKAIINSVLAKAKKVAIGADRDFKHRRAEVIGIFEKNGVDVETVLKLVEVQKLQDITGDQLKTLIGITTAIENGDYSWEALINGDVSGTGKPATKKPVKKENSNG